MGGGPRLCLPRSTLGRGDRVEGAPEGPRDPGVQVAEWWILYRSAWTPSSAAVLRWVGGPWRMCSMRLRGTASGFWPYPFLDPTNRGAGRVVVNVMDLALALAGADTTSGPTF